MNIQNDFRDKKQWYVKCIMIQSKYYSVKTRFGSYTGTERHFSRIIIGMGWCSIHASLPTSTSFRVIPFLSLRRIVYSLILDFSAETIWALLFRVWTFGARCAFLFFHAYRGMLLWWSSSTSIWAEERIRMHTFLSSIRRIARAGNIDETLTLS